MKKLVLLLLPLFLSAYPDNHKEGTVKPNGFSCCRCLKNKLHDDQIRIAIQWSTACVSAIVGLHGFMAGKTYTQQASLAVIYAGLTYGILCSIGSWAQDRFMIIGPDYKCPSNPGTNFCQYAP